MISNWFDNVTYRIERVEFADGTVWDVSTLATAKFMGTDASDYLIGSTAADRMEGLGGNDYLSGNAGDDTLDGARGLIKCWAVLATIFSGWIT
ncbi:MAG: outer membrane adhesin-like protein, partial [Halothiobacillaceae bacterium]